MKKEINNKFYSYSFILIIFLGFLFTFKLNHSNRKPILKIPMELSASNYSSNFLKFTSLGNTRMVSSLMWTHTLLFSDIDHYKGEGLNSWMYHRFNTISDLDPKMYETYYYGGQYLSIVKDDIVGAEAIYNKGLTYFPNDLWLNYLSGFNYIYELGEIEKGIERFLHIKDHPDLMKTIPILPSITAKLLKSFNRLPIAYQLLHNAWNKSEDDFIKKRYYNSLYAIKAEIDLKCLNSNESQCQKRDFDNNPYLLEDGIYKARKVWKKFEISKRVREKAHP
ncbi:MAG: hypothetical protein KC493_03195 [Bacteriovoracaceae bacterium]|nr:hypothetical protein [Bacteriovoracaceae bacterium]